MTQGVPHDESVKAACLAALLTGQSVSAVARDYRIPRTTIIRWRNESGVTPRTVSNSKKAEIGDLVAEYLRQNLTTLSSHAEQFRDKNWLRKQDASGAAVLHGVMCDKAVRLLEALAGSDDDEATEEEDA